MALVFFEDSELRDMLLELALLDDDVRRTLSKTFNAFCDSLWRKQ